MTAGAATSLTSVPILLHLVQRDEYRGNPAELKRGVEARTVPGVDPAELPLLEAGLALAVGDAKRAVRSLEAHPFADGSDAAIVARALVNLGNALDRNWFPGGGGAVLEEGDITRIAGEPPTAASDAPHVQLLVSVTGDIAAMAPVWRSVVEGAYRTGQPATAAAILTQVESVGARIAPYGVPGTLAYLALIHADLLWRSGEWQAAANRQAWAFQAYQGMNDLVGIGACWLAKGDWSATPLSHPELLGLSLEGPMSETATVVEADPASARASYEQAKACFTATAAPRGLGAVELRLAYLDGQAEEWPAAVEHLEHAVVLARECGDASSEQLASVHRAIAAFAAGAPLDPTAVGADIARWAQQDGSYSYARGLARLCLAVARRLRERGEVLRARPPLRLADALNTGIGAVVEPALVSGEVAQLYGGANYRRAMLVLTELDLESALARGASRMDDALVWLSLVEGATQASATATALRDPDAIARGAARLGRLAEAVPAAADPRAVDAVQGTVIQARVLVPLYRGMNAREDGRMEEAELAFDDAQKEADALGDGGAFLRLVVLATRRRREEGLPLAEALVAAGQLPPDFAAEVFQRLGAPAKAKSELAKMDAIGAPAPSARPWEADALPAEVQESLGEWRDASKLATGAIEKFEEHLARLSRDVLRLNAMDDKVVVGLYTTAVRADLDADGGNGSTAGSAFRLSDRCRGIALADLFASDQAAGQSADVVEAVRSWHREGVRLASLFEQIRWDDADDAREVRTRVAEAERALDDAEAALDAVAPTLLRQRRSPPETPSLEEVQSLLRPESLLLQYHFFDDELIVWAVTDSETRTVRRPALTALAGDVRRFQRACADLSSTKEERSETGLGLAELVLAPFSRELDARSRVVIVPHSRLDGLPFHLLPFEGDLLGARRAVSYLPSSSAAPRWRGHPAPRLGADALVVGDPAYAPERRLPRLRGAHVEAQVVARLLGATALTDADVSGTAVATRIGRAHTAHFATHGLVPQAAPNSAQLALAGAESLTLADLMGLDTDLDLAVLSACDTGRGAATAGGEVIGLTRALLAAGARDVVVSLWPVDDVAGCLTMVDFYQELKEHGDVSAALAAAQNRVRAESVAERQERFDALHDGEATSAAELAASREWGAAAAQRPQTVDPGHPYFWGPFVHTGL